MSGKRQHFIPRFLQNGFSSHSIGNETFTWVYRKGNEPFNSNIINVGVEGYFYSQDGDNEVDDEITSLEPKFSNLIDNLRSNPNIATINPETIAEMLAHLEIRTRNLRQGFTNTAKKVTEEALRFAEDKDAFSSYIIRIINDDPTFLENIIKQEIKKHNLPEHLIPQILSNSKPLIAQLLPSALCDMSPFIKQFRDALPSLMKNASKLGHIKALRQNISPQFKIEKYKSLQFRILKTKIPLPLGDSAVIFKVDAKRSFKAFYERDDILLSTYLPISPETILIGSNDNTDPDISEIPMAIAQCSLEYFIGNTLNDGHRILHKHIGEHAYFLSNEQIETLITDSINPIAPALSK